MNPLLTIAYIQFGRLNWFRRAIDEFDRQYSALPNDLKAVIECVVCDDGFRTEPPLGGVSEGDTREVLSGRPFPVAYRRRRDAEIAGIVPNHMRVMEEARGEYLWIPGNDDLFRPGGLERVVRAVVEQRGTRYFYVDYGYWHGQDPPADTGVPECMNFFEKSLQSGPLPNLLPLLKDPNVFTPMYCSIMQRGDWLESVRGWTPELGRFKGERDHVYPHFIIDKLLHCPCYAIGGMPLLASYCVLWNVEPGADRWEGDMLAYYRQMIEQRRDNPRSATFP